MKLQAFCQDEVAPSRTYQAPRDVTGARESRRLSPDGARLWLCVSTLEDGASITWNGDHGDDGIYVLDGAIEVQGRTCPAGGAVIVESGVAVTARAVGTTSIVHAGTTDRGLPPGGELGPPDPDGHGVHVIGPEGRFVSGSDENVRAVWFSDGTCSTCRIQLFTVSAGPEKGRGPAHSHSEDEIIYLLGGSVRLGAHRYGAGWSLCIPANTRYALTTDEDGHVFLNFRAGVSTQVYERDRPPVLETAAARGGMAVDAST